MDFSFKLNEIKFCTLLMYWLIQEKLFTYFYNTFRPVNHMHYITCGVHSHFCSTLDHCFIMTNSIHSWGDLQIHFSVIFGESRHHAQSHLTSGAPIHSSLSLATEQHRRQCSTVHDFAGQCLLW
jgi:hypothetical protein